MKKIVLGLSLGIVLAACGNDSKPLPASEDSTQKSSTPSPADADAEKGLELVAKTGCLQCHKVSETFTGPSYEAIAERYKDRPGIVDTLARKVIKGGSGNWGTIPMTPNDVPEEDAKLMVKYVLSLKK